jgi:cysteine desulfurase
MDNHATTRVDPRVVDAMLPAFDEVYGNPASRHHRFGWKADDLVEAARRRVAELVGAASSKEILFTSGATESNNLALKGLAHFYRDRGDHLITQRTEHRAVLDTMRRLEREGYRVTYLDTNTQGVMDPEAVAGAIDERTLAVSVMLANNEVGAIQPIAAIGEVTRARGVFLHCDVVQGIGRIPFDVEAMRVDLASISAHKMYGPKGVGALYVRRRSPRLRLVGEIDGGGHERGMRSGTLNVPGVVGLGSAAALMMAERDDEAVRVRSLRDDLWARLTGALDDVHLNGPPLDGPRLPNNLNVSFGGVEGEGLILALKDDVAVSSGSACTSANLEPSYVLRALGVEADLADASIRFGLGRFNTAEEVERVASRVVAEVTRLRRGAN